MPAIDPTGPAGAATPPEADMTNVPIAQAKAISYGPAFGAMTIDGRTCIQVYAEGAWWWQTADGKGDNKRYRAHAWSQAK